LHALPWEICSSASGANIECNAKGYAPKKQPSSLVCPARRTDCEVVNAYAIVFQHFRATDSVPKRAVHFESDQPALHFQAICLLGHGLSDTHGRSQISDKGIYTNLKTLSGAHKKGRTVLALPFSPYVGKELSFKLFP